MILNVEFIQISDVRGQRQGLFSEAFRSHSSVGDVFVGFRMVLKFKCETSWVGGEGFENIENALAEANQFIFFVCLLELWHE